MGRLIAIDCIEAMKAMPPESVDAVVTDPPYGLEFMGKEWDKLDGWRPDTAPSGISHKVPDGTPRWSRIPPHAMAAMQKWHLAWAREALRVLKPGGHLLAFGGTRTFHRLTCAIEDAGFEIRDTIMWLYGSGFPKSMDVSKAIDKAAGVEREVVGSYRTPEGGQELTTYNNWGSGERRTPTVTAAATPEAKAWEGWGTALKPSHEPIIVARKPIEGTVAENVLKHGTGGINIDGCRVSTVDGLGGGAYRGGIRPKSAMGLTEGDWGKNSMLKAGTSRLKPEDFRQPSGRFPPNLVLTHHPDCGEECVEGCHVRELGEQSGERTSGALQAGTTRHTTPPCYGRGYAKAGRILSIRDYVIDSGTAARFFPCFKYEPKASTDERSLGLESDRNRHPTVKPLDLMRWLVRLVTPPEGIVLDPFLGSGTTAMAAILEGKDWIGIERETEYVEISKARIEWAEEHVKRFGLPPLDMGTLDAVERRESEDDKDQTSLF